MIMCFDCGYKFTQIYEPNELPGGSVSDDKFDCGDDNATEFELFNHDGELVAKGLFDGDPTVLDLSIGNKWPELEVEIDPNGPR